MDAAAELVEAGMYRVGNIPGFGFPFRHDLHFFVMFVFLRERAAGEEYLGGKVFLEAVEGRCWVAVWPAGCRYELEAETDDGGQGSWDVRFWGS